MKLERNAAAEPQTEAAADATVETGVARDERAILRSGTGVVERQRGDRDPVERSKTRVGHGGSVTVRSYGSRSYRKVRNWLCWDSKQTERGKQPWQSLSRQGLMQMVTFIWTFAALLAATAKPRKIAFAANWPYWD